MRVIGLVPWEPVQSVKAHRDGPTNIIALPYLEHQLYDSHLGEIQMRLVSRTTENLIAAIETSLALEERSPNIKVTSLGSHTRAEWLWDLQGVLQSYEVERSAGEHTLHHFVPTYVPATWEHWPGVLRYRFHLPRGVQEGKRSLEAIQAHTLTPLHLPVKYEVELERGWLPPGSDAAAILPVWQTTDPVAACVVDHLNVVRGRQGPGFQ